MRFGVARGVFSNEAGLGSAPIAHAAARTDHPVRQGLWGVFEVFADTIVICSLTALTILTSGVWSSGVTGAALTTAAFNEGMPGPGGIIVAVGILFFAFSTLLSWAYYGEKCAEYILGSGFNKIYRIIWLPLIVLGAIGSLTMIWDIADTLNGLMAIPNLVALLGLSGVVVKLTKEFFADEKNLR
jgi:AGCS family alanine or glycine:cation symporter